MAIEIQDIKNKPFSPLKAADIKIVGYNNTEFKQISTKNLVELNSKGKIPTQYLDFTDLIFMGVYNAETNEPVITDSIGENNQYYIVNVAGSQNLGSGVLVMNTDDRLVYYNEKWNLVPTDSNLEYNDIFDI